MTTEMNWNDRVLLNRKFFRESNDQTVIALADAAMISYTKAHAIAKEAGRQNNTKIELSKIMEAAKNHGVKFRKVEIEWEGVPKEKITAGGFAKTAGANGRFLVSKGDAPFNIVNGVLENVASDRVFVSEVYQVEV